MFLRLCLFVLLRVGVIYVCNSGSTCYHQITTDISPAHMTVILALIHLLKYKLCLLRGVYRHLWTWIQQHRYSLTLHLFSLHCILFMRFCHQMSLFSFCVVHLWKLCDGHIDFLCFMCILSFFNSLFFLYFACLILVFIIQQGYVFR